MQNIKNNRKTEKKISFETKLLVTGNVRFV